MFGLGATELLIIFGILILLFGANRLPKLARSAGEAIRALKDGTQAVEEAEPLPPHRD